MLQTEYILILILIYFEYFLCCDDLKLFSVSSIDKIQNDIDSLSSWSILNELDFHPDKCKICSFSQRYNNGELYLNGSLQL